jgi:hypothetical protein
MFQTDSPLKRFDFFPFETAPSDFKPESEMFLLAKRGLIQSFTQSQLWRLRLLLMGVAPLWCRVQLSNSVNSSSLNGQPLTISCSGRSWFAWHSFSAFKICLTSNGLSNRESVLEFFPSFDLFDSPIGWPMQVTHLRPSAIDPIILSIQ